MSKKKAKSITPAQGFLQTMDYDLFVFRTDNRGINDKHLKNLDDSFQKGVRTAHAVIECTRRPDGKLEIQTGHHRFRLCKELRLPIVFTIIDRVGDPEDLPHKPWDQYDHLASKINLGENHDYLVLDRFRKDTGITLGLCVALLSGNLGPTQSTTKSFRNNTFRLAEDTQMAATVREVVLACREQKIPFATNRDFVMAVAAVSLVESFDVDQLIKRIKANPGLMRKKMANRAQYLELIQNVYFRQSKGERLNLEWLAEKEIDKRRTRKRH